MMYNLACKHKKYSEYMSIILLFQAIELLPLLYNVVLGAIKASI